MTLDPEFIGYELIQRGFKDFFLYLFRLIEGRPFIVEPIHEDLFKMIDDILNMREIRVSCGLPPRSAKSTICKWLIVYAWTINPKCNFIYTSFSQSLLATISTEIAGILEHPVYKAMYPNRNIYQESFETRPIDSYWEDYLRKQEGKNFYSTKKITTYAGGSCLFISKGSALTGFGAAIRNAKGFSGGIILDDFDKTQDIHSKTMREKSYKFYTETLLSRLNNSNAFILNVQQRLHIADITGFLKERYNFKTIKRPLVDEQGICQIPSQYSPERIEELKKDNYMWQSQYMQNPFMLSGAVIKREWFNYYDSSKKYKYKRLIITADTAMKVKEHNDYSVFMSGGLTEDNKLHVLDMIRGKWEAPELEKRAVEFWNRFKDINAYGTTASGLYIESRASGIGLAQSLKTKYSMPVFEIEVSKDKLTRVEEVTPYIESGVVLLPDNENALFNPDLLSECEEFSRDDSHAHDDSVDALSYLIMEMLSKREVSLLDFFMQ